MSREIKFRGKRIDNGEWVYGNLFVPDKLVGGVYISPTTTFFDFMPGFEDGQNFDEYKKQHPGIALGHFYQVIPETVGQYTGLKDKNGKESYQGDIYRPFPSHPENKIYKMEWDDEKARFHLNPIGGAGGVRADFVTHMERIGNIYENPELL